MSDVVIIYSEDSLGWNDYLIQRLTGPNQEIKTKSILLADLETNKNDITEAKCVVVIASPDCLEHFVKTPECKVSLLTGQASRCILLLLGVTEADINKASGPGVDLCPRFPQYDSWNKISHEKPDDLLMAVVSTIDKYNEKSTRMPPPTQPRPIKVQKKPTETGEPSSHSKPTPTTVDKPTPKTRRRPGTAPAFDLCPHEVRCEVKTMVTIILQDSVPEDVQVTLVLTGADNSVIGMLKTRRCNPYTYTFSTPVHPEEKVSASVMVTTGDDQTTQKSLGTRSLKYVSQTEEIWSLLQVPLSLLENACRMLKEAKTPATDMDRELSRAMDELMEVLPPKTFEQLFGIHFYSENESSNHVTPTLLHLASRYGLRDLLVKLMDLPDSGLACSITNSKKQQPAAIASAAGHMELATYLSSHQEVNNHMEGIYMAMMAPLYDKCKTRGHPEYDLPFQVPIGCDDDIYLYMAGDRPRTVSDSYYMDMASGKATEDSEGDDEPSYEPVSNIERQPHKKGAVYVPDPMTSPLDVNPNTMDMPKSQRDLVDILNLTKNKEISISEAERLFREWQLQHKAPKSFKEKQAGLDKMRQELQNVKQSPPEVKRKPWARNIMTVFRKSEDKKLGKGGDTRIYRRQPAIPEGRAVAEAEYLPLVDGNSPRTSSTSTYSSDRGSTASTDSAYETDGHYIDDQLPLRRHQNAGGQVSSKRDSLREQYEEELKHPSAEAPPVPPRLPRQNPVAKTRQGSAKAPPLPARR